MSQKTKAMSIDGQDELSNKRHKTLIDILDSTEESTEETTSSSSNSISREIKSISNEQIVGIIRNLLTSSSQALSSRVQKALLNVNVNNSIANGNNSNGKEHETSPEASSPFLNFYGDEKTKTQHRDFDFSLLDVASFVPMRLNTQERKIFNLLEHSLRVSDYTDNVDVYAAGRRMQNIGENLYKFYDLLTGLLVSTDYEESRRKLLARLDNAKNGEKSVASDGIDANYFSAVFEVGRRYKILNPERMRETYVKLMYILQDAFSIQSDLKNEVFTMHMFVKNNPIITVANFIGDKMSSKEAFSDFLTDPNLLKVCDCYHDTELASDVHIKELKNSAYKNLVRDYVDKEIMSTTDLDLIVSSFSDFNSYLHFNSLPVKKMQGYLKQLFSPDVISKRKNDEHKPSRFTFPNVFKDTVGKGVSLAIRSGQNGARLSHNHSDQYRYVFQSLTVWKLVLENLFVLWHAAETDLIGEGGYRLQDTGQGLNRVQRATHVGHGMSRILDMARREVDEETGGWVGSSVVHLGDHNVPNALMFIDKYTQIPRILGPIVLCIEKLPEIYAHGSSSIRNFIDAPPFYGVESAIRLILQDFYKHGFDGSGADNSFDAGSCVDGRLTSCWNWCSKIERKDYFPLFLLSGFGGFDGGEGWS